MMAIVSHSQLWRSATAFVLMAALCATSISSAQIYPADANSPALDSGLSGSWFDPGKDGQGLTLQVIDSTQILTTWFTYDDQGSQAWMQGIGELINGEIVVKDLSRFTGPQFGESYEPSDRQTRPAGELTLSFSGCNAGEARYTGGDGLPADSLQLERLTSLQGHPCGQTDSSALGTYPPTAKLSGAWYAPSQDGQGWMVEMLDARTALVYWFTYDQNGQQRWMLGVGGLDEGTLAIDDLEILSGPEFGPDYDTSDILRERWGDLTLHLWPCQTGLARYIENRRSGSMSGVQPLVPIAQTNPCVAPREKSYATDIWDTDDVQRWRADDLENKTPFCQNRSVRWNAPVSNFDINLDGKNDVLLPIGCYQGEDPEPGEGHNREVKGAWHIFCSTPDDRFEDCTETLFGTPEIRATVAHDPGGGNPYTHVMQQPRDLNGDGYPEIWYALNRDDGRPLLDWDDPEESALIEKFCGPREPGDNEWDCTWKSIQTALISNPDGTYEVHDLPWGPRHTQALIALPNDVGTYDFFGLNYGEWTAARLTEESTLVNITETVGRDYKNIDIALTGMPYAKTFEHEDTLYVVSAEVPRHIVARPNQETWPTFLSGTTELIGWERGFVLWEWIPSVGFELADFHLPDTEDTFTYKLSMGNDSYAMKSGAYIRDIPVYSPMWHFFEFTQLHPHEEPVLVVTQEAKTTGGQYFGAPHDPDAIYNEQLMEIPGDYQYRLMLVSVIEGFYIRDGKLVPRPQSIVEGDAVWGLPALRFIDLNKDGYTDFYGHTGGGERPSLYLNNRRGTLEKLDVQSVKPDVSFVDDVSGFGDTDLRFGAFTMRPLGENDTLHFIFWGEGWASTPGYLDPDHQYEPPEFSILQSDGSVDEIARETPEALQKKIEACVGAGPGCIVY